MSGAPTHRSTGIGGTFGNVRANRERRPARYPRLWPLASANGASAGLKAFAPATAVPATSDGQEMSTGFEIVPVSQNGTEGKMIPVAGHPL